MTMATSTAMNAEHIARTLGKAHHSTGGWWLCIAPCHEDSGPSFQVRDDPDNPGRIQTVCMASGCPGHGPGGGKFRAAALRARGLWPSSDRSDTGPNPFQKYTKAAPQKTEPTIPFIVPVPDDAPPWPKSLKGVPFDLAYQHRDHEGRLIFLHCRWHATETERKRFAFLSYSKRGWVWKRPPVEMMPGGLLPVYGEHLLQDAEIAVICEGQKTADAISELPGFRGVTAGPGKEMDRCDWSRIAQRSRVILAPDAGFDDVMDGVAKRWLADVPDLRFVRNPEGAEKNWDLADCDPHTRRALLMAAEPYEREPQWEPDAEAMEAIGEEPDSGPAQDERPAVFVGIDERKLVDASLRALAMRREFGIYRRGTMLVEVPTNASAADESGQASIRIISGSKVRVHLSQALTFLKGSLSQRKAVPVPRSLPQAIVEWGEYSEFPELVSLAEHPCMVAGNRLLDRPGYDGPTGVLMVAGARKFEPVPEAPSAEEAKQAAAEILSDFEDFPFETDADKSAFLAYFLTIFCRDAIRGPVPSFVFTANDQGAGKSKLARAPWLVALGRDVGVFGGLPKTTDELDKRILASVVMGTRAIIFDNVTGRIGGDALAVLVTSGAYSGRILGRTENVSVRNNWVVAITANNATVDADQASRSVFVRLDAPPGNRDRAVESYRHRDIDRHLLHETSHVRRALTILHAYVAAGCPEVGARSMRDFHGWTGLVSSAIMFAGLPDPLMRQKEIAEESDSETTSYATLLEAVESLCIMRQCFDGMTVAEIARAAETVPDLLDALLGVRAVKAGRVETGILGRVFRTMRGKPIDGRRLENRIATNSKAAAKWRVVRLMGTPAAEVARPDGLPF